MNQLKPRETNDDLGVTGKAGQGRNGGWGLLTASAESGTDGILV